MLRGTLALIGLIAAGPAPAAECTQSTFDGARFTACAVDLETENLRLFLRGPDGVPLGSFDRVDAVLAGSGARLGVAMNAGMYHADRSPVGLYIEDGKAERGIVTSDGPGNFGLLPNGVFCVMQARAAVIETRRFAADPPDCVHATQSGPMLVIDGALHPRFLPKGTSLYRRNGVGVSEDGRTVWLVISEDRVNFHHFGRFFRDALGLRQALYLDGNVSRLHAPDLGRSDGGRAMGPVLGVVDGVE